MCRLRVILGCLAVLLALATTAARSQDGLEQKSPVQLVRSLQVLQDSVAAGDHSAMELQRHLLVLIDRRLRQADASVFAQSENVEAAMIYVMSGGNPSMLDFMVARYPEQLDPELASVVRAYLNGVGHARLDEMDALLKRYERTSIEPYLALIAGSSALVEKPARALEFLDRARLLLPGSIVEEAALRRSLEASLKLGEIEDGLVRSARYARRFLHSPYASQFADILVDLVIAHPETVEAQRLERILAALDEDRRLSVYLRIARKAAIAGNADLARQAAELASSLHAASEKAEALAALYSGAAGVSTAEVEHYSARIEALEDLELSERDRALRKAAQAIASAITDQPVLKANVTEPDLDSNPVQPAVKNASDEMEDTAAFIDARRDRLGLIDDLLEEAR